MIRTVGRPWSNRPSLALTITTLLVVAIAGVLPFSPVAGTLGLTPLPPSFSLFVIVVVATYLGLVEIVKHRVIARLAGRPASSPHEGRVQTVPGEPCALVTAPHT